METELGLDLGLGLDLDTTLNDDAAKDLGIDTEVAPKKRAPRIKFDENTLMNPNWGLPFIHANAASKLLGMVKKSDGTMSKPRKKLDSKNLLAFYAFAAYKMAPGVHFEDFMDKARRIGTRASIRRLRKDWVDDEERANIQARMGIVEYGNEVANGVSAEAQTVEGAQSVSADLPQQATNFVSGFEEEDEDDIFVSRTRARPRIQENGDDIFVTRPTSRAFDSGDEDVPTENEKSRVAQAPSSPVQFEYPLSESNPQADSVLEGSAKSSAPTNAPANDFPFEFDLDMDDEELLNKELVSTEQHEPTNEDKPAEVNSVAKDLPFDIDFEEF